MFWYHCCSLDRYFIVSLEYFWWLQVSVCMSLTLKLVATLYVISNSSFFYIFQILVAYLFYLLIGLTKINKSSSYGKLNHHPDGPTHNNKSEWPMFVPNVCSVSFVGFFFFFFAAFIWKIFRAMRCIEALISTKFWSAEWMVLLDWKFWTVAKICYVFMAGPWYYVQGWNIVLNLNISAYCLKVSITLKICSTCFLLKDKFQQRFSNVRNPHHPMVLSSLLNVVHFL